ncbi:Acyl-n-acyltransferase [Mycena venus]|uniref:Acyl-n-acyltransferase n=1 Tax=Mycena venus TaxID=2733690 RepID=A0A8H6YX76_9AGAR|nr:Acyl-n-acyltransferase [Mycena venus]
MPKPLPSGLEVRQARADDVPSLATLLSLAPDDGSIYRFPHILEYPDEMREMHAGWLRPGVHDPTTLIRIAVVPGDGKDRVVGFTSWTRLEADPQDPSKTRPAKLAAKVAPAEEPETEEDTSNFAPPPPRALVPNVAHAEAIKRARKQAPPSPIKTTACYELGGLAIHPDYQGHGIGSLLARWGVDKAAGERVPVFVSGETQGVDFYEKALGFQRLRATEYWLDEKGQDISREEVQHGNEAWKKVNGGLSGAQMVWLPEGYVLEVDGEVYKG